MHVTEESDSGIVPMNHSNKIEQSMAESEEERTLIEENTYQAGTRPTQCGHACHRVWRCAESSLTASPPPIRK
jgi:hypothetical protein